MKNLTSVFPERCCTITVSDAGFRGPWFKAVEELDWHWIGRIRNVVKHRHEETEPWRNTTSLYRSATHTPKYLDWRWLSKRTSYGCYLHLCKALRRVPGRPRKRKGKGTKNPKARQHAGAPWLLATSLSPKHWSARRIARAYEKRMQIEETFCDLQSHRWLYGLQFARSRCVKRMGTLLLVTTLATAATWLAGLAVQAKGWARHFQANTITNRAVLSVLFLGCCVLRSPRLVLNRTDLWNGADELPILVNQCSQYA